MDSGNMYTKYDGDNGNDDSRSQQSGNYGYHKPGAAITSMVLGICSLSMWFYPFISSIPCIIMGIVAVRLAKSAESRTDPKHFGFLKAGRITGIIGIIISVLYTLIMTLIIVNAANGNYYRYR